MLLRFSGCKDVLLTQVSVMTLLELWMILVRHPELVSKHSSCTQSTPCMRTGTVQPLRDEVDDDTFLYDLCKRADMTWDNVQLDGQDPCASRPISLL